MNLNHLSTINSGFYSSTIKEGDVYYLQARDFNEERKIVQNLKPTLSYTKNIEKHFLNEGDVLIVAKGASFLSVVFDASYSPAVASTVFLVIRIRDKRKLLPQFLSWYINLPKTQLELLMKGEGTKMPTISKKIIQELEIPLPTIKVQENIIKIEELKREEKFLNRKINELKDIQLNQLILNAIIN
ncbi:MAG: hypothetical protein RL308_1671 [Bacteroidota bacterium]|jgi:restriction endonuclease S subunit